MHTRTTSRTENARRTLSAFACALACAGTLGAQQALQPRMGDPLPGIGAAQTARFNAGRASFERVFTAAEGLGPAFNEIGCQQCHENPATGGSSDKFVTRFGKAAVGALLFDPLTQLGGSLLQSQAISTSCEEALPAQADVVAQRITPPLFGLGLVEAIPDADILLNEAFPPPGVSGRAHVVLPLEPPAQPRVGRMGWKAQIATLLSFSADASLNEIGITNRLLQQESAPNGDAALLAQCDAVSDPEDQPDAFGVDEIDRQRDFQRFLAPPPQTPRTGMSGELVFQAAGCAACHLATAFVADASAEPGIAGVAVRPYSDFLLHDMGSLGDGIVQGDARENEFRTAPLWGLRARGELSLLHDGRAHGGTFDENVISAVGFHDGEASASRDAFLALSVDERTRLIAFLGSLGRAEFDWDANHTIDEFDWFFLEPLCSGPSGSGSTASYTPDDAASVADFDQDGDVDLLDFGVMQRAFTGQ